LTVLLQKPGIGSKELPGGISLGETIDAVERSKSKVACVTAVPPFAYMHTRYLCRRLRNQFNQLKLTVAFLSGNETGDPHPTQGLPAADETASSLREAVPKIVTMLRTNSVSAIQPAAL
jgi:hypothetical protein